MIPALIVFLYLGIVLYLGVFAFRRGGGGEEFFVAGRKLGPAVFLLSLFGTNMTAVAILGSSGMAYSRGVGVYGLMASAAGLVIPLSILFLGTRLWTWGKRFGHITQAQMFRDRWECGGIATFFAVLTAIMLVPMLVVGMIGGGTTLETLSDGAVPYSVGAAVVAAVVVSYVFFGGMRGTAWVNAFQTVLFLVFGSIAFFVIARSLGGFDQVMADLAANPKTAPLLSRERIPAEEFISYMLVPLSSIMFPHMAIMCMTAERIGHFKKTVVLYPICILLIWLPSVYLGVVAASKYPGLATGEANDVVLRLLTDHAPLLLAGVLGAGIMACVMASDSQILALGTLFSEDVFAPYGGRARWGAKAEVWAARVFIVVVGCVAYGAALNLKDSVNLFELAVRFTFSGFAALSPIMVAALYWRRSTKWGAFAATAWVASCMMAVAWLTRFSDSFAPKAPGPPVPIFPELGNLFLRGPTQVTLAGFLPVLPMVVGSGLLVLIVSLLTRPPSSATLERYFPSRRAL